jgi:hypothetical protein
MRRKRNRPEAKALRHPALVAVTSGRRCNICRRVIKAVPADVDPRYARYCYSCRSHREQDCDANRWIGRGDGSGAGTGFYIFG